MIALRPLGKLGWTVCVASLCWAAPAWSQTRDASADAGLGDAGVASAEAADDPSAACQECHADPVKSRREHPSPGQRASTRVDPAALARSEHRGMACGDCHVKAFEQYPHPEDAPLPRCQDCHVQNQADQPEVAFAEINADFERSVHAERHTGFRCSACHDAHTLQLETTRARTYEHNKVCLRCHANEAVFAAIADEQPPDLAEVHTWLPNRALHWRKVRCLDCHTSYEPVGSHLVLPKEEAVKKCVSCHSSSSILKLKLYRHRRNEDLERIGFLNAMIMNDAYVVGATRNVWLDMVGVGISAVTGIGIAFHGLLRLIARRLMRRGGGGHG